MRYLLSILAILHVAILPPVVAQSSATASEAPPVQHQLIEGDYILITVDEASEGEQTFPISVPVRLSKTESEDWELEILGDELPAERGVIPIAQIPGIIPRMPGRILFQTVYAPGEHQFSTTVFTGSLGDPYLIRGRYYRIPGSGGSATEGRFTLQRMK